MNSRERRQQASDVFRETDFVFVKKGSFAEAFPEIATLQIVVEETGHGATDEYRRRTYGIENFPGEYVNCRNNLCYNGGVSIGEMLRELVSNRRTEHDAFKACQGYKGSPKGRRKYGPCGNYFRVKLIIEYKKLTAERLDGPSSK